MAIHLPGTLAAFYFWLGAHFPAARHGCQWMYGWRQGGTGNWRIFCR
jgi:hypothetical protein